MVVNVGVIIFGGASDREFIGNESVTSRVMIRLMPNGSLRIAPLSTPRAPCFKC